MRDSYPIPLMGKFINLLGKASFFSTLDANSEYWQIEINDANKDKTAITSYHSLCRFVRMPFGLCNAPGTFQRAMDVILSSTEWQFALVFLNDNVVFSETAQQHINHVLKVLSQLHNAGATLKLKMCKFFRSTTNYLGHGIRQRRLELASHMMDAICGLRPPSNLTELRPFLGLRNTFPTIRP